MPELPEVETIRLGLKKAIVGKTIAGVEIRVPKLFHGDKADIIDKKIVDVNRRAKQIIIDVEGDNDMLIHLKMTGQLIYRPKHESGIMNNELWKDQTAGGHPSKDWTAVLPNTTTHIIFEFSDGSKLFFNDQRKFGWVKLLDKAELIEAQNNLGLDILSSNFTPKYLLTQLQTSSRPIKSVLLDQNKFAGIGNIYANDALFLSKIHPNFSSKKINLKKATLLHGLLIKIMTESIKSGGSTAKDNKYVHPDGSSGTHQFSFQVYQREKEPCLICQTPIKKVKIGGRGTFYCPMCQKLII